MVGCCGRWSHARSSDDAVHDILLTLQSGTVRHHVTRLSSVDSRRVWSVSCCEVLCCAQFTVSHQHVLGSSGCTYHHHDAGGRWTAVQCLRQSTRHVQQLGLWRRAGPQPVRSHGQLHGHADHSTHQRRLRSVTKT